MNEISIIKGDIKTIQVDAAVNYSTEQHIDRCIDDGQWKAKQPDLYAAFQKLREHPQEALFITDNHDHSCKHVIYTIEPQWQQNADNNIDQLTSVYKDCLSLAFKHQIKSIAFPAISVTAPGLSQGDAVKAAIEEIRNVLCMHPNMEVLIICPDNQLFELYQRVVAEY